MSYHCTSCGLGACGLDNEVFDFFIQLFINERM